MINRGFSSSLLFHSTSFSLSPSERLIRVERGCMAAVSPPTIAVRRPLGPLCNWHSGLLQWGRTLKGPFALNRMEMWLIEQISASNCCITLTDAPLGPVEWTSSSRPAAGPRGAELNQARFGRANLSQDIIR